MSELPVASNFTLPNDRWVPSSEEGIDAVLLRLGDYPRLRPNILVETAELRPEATLKGVADFVVDRIRPTSLNVELLERRELGGEGAEGYFQAVSLQIPVDDVVLDALQLSTLFSLVDRAAGRAWACWLTLTCLRDDASVVGPEFEQLVASTTFEPRSAETNPAG